MRETKTVHVKYRESIPDDLPFVISSWAKSENNMRSLIYRDVWKRKNLKRMTAEVKDIISRPNTRILITVDAKDPRVIYSYIVFDYQSIPDAIVVHYVYTRWIFRQSGLAHELYKLINPEDLPVYSTIAHSTVKQSQIKHTLLPHPLNEE